MKAYRVGTVCLGAGLFLAGRLTGAREFFVLALALALLLLFALALNLWTLFSYSYVQELSSPVSVKGQERTLQVGIYNDKPFPFTRMQVAVETVRGEEYRLSFNLPPRNSVHFQIPIPCPYRGMYRVGMTRLEMNDIFGLLRLSYDMRRLPYYRQRELKILPRAVELPFLPSRRRDPKLTGTGAGLFAQAGESYRDLRDYRPGDSAKRIHWKQSLRRGALLVKEYESPLESGALLALDTGVSGLEGEAGRRYADLACECAAAIAIYAMKAGHPVKLVSACPEQRPVEESPGGGYQRLLEWLAALPFERQGDLPGCIRQHTARREQVQAVYALTRSPSRELGKALLDLQSRGCGVTCLLLAPGSRGERELEGVRCIRLELGDSVAQRLGDAL